MKAGTVMDGALFIDDRTTIAPAHGQPAFPVEERTEPFTKRLESPVAGFEQWSPVREIGKQVPVGERRTRDDHAWCDPEREQARADDGPQCVDRNLVGSALRG